MIRVKAFAGKMDEPGSSHVVWRGHDPSKRPSEFHRLLGGHVEFGETSRDAVVREIREELGVDLVEPELLGVLESIFEYDGRPGHEVVFVYAGRMSYPDVVPPEGATFLDDDTPHQGRVEVHRARRPSPVPGRVRRADRRTPRVRQPGPLSRTRGVRLSHSRGRRTRNRPDRGRVSQFCEKRDAGLQRAAPRGRDRLLPQPVGYAGRHGHSVVRTPSYLRCARRIPLVSKPVVLIAEELSSATVEVLGPDFEIRRCNGADRAELLSAIGDTDAVLVRSATRVDAEALAEAGRLKVIARAGVGLDNVDVKAATQAGVMVVNAPTSNIVSAAELAVGLLLAAARNIAPANDALKKGEWKRSKYAGVELYEKTVGIVGLGRIGVLVAQRLSAFGMNVVAYDPYVQPGRAAQMGVRLVTLDELLEQADFISVHLPKTPETLGMIGDDELHKVKPTVVVVNAARGGIVDEVALHAAIKEGRVAGAGIDVFASEPCTDSPLFEFESVVATPHLGASTEEAQEKAGVAVARSVRLALAGELVPDAVNVQGGVIAEDVRPGIPLTEKLGRIFTALAGGVAQQLDVEVRGEITEYDVKVLELAALKGVFADVVEEAVSYVNAPLLAAERGLEVRLVTEPESPDHRNLVTLRGTLADGTQVSVSATLIGIAQRERLVEVNGFDVDVEPTDHVAFFRYADRPGMVGIVGGILGQARVNIAGMQVSRDHRGGHALVAMTVDNAIPAPVLDEITTAIDAESVRTVDLSD